MKKLFVIFLILFQLFPVTVVYSAPDPFAGPGSPSDTGGLILPSEIPQTSVCDAISALGINSLQDLINSTGCMISKAGTLMVPLAVLFFLYGLMKFVLASGNEEAKESGKRIMIWGIVALFVMVSVWGIITLLQSNLGVEALPFPNN